MSRNRWHILREGDTLTLARHLPVRMDVEAETLLPDGSRLGLARQVRQDMWRRLQSLRGFSPVVRVKRGASGCHVTAGGRVEGVFPRHQVKATLQTMLDDPRLRRRWSAHAAHGGQAHG